MTRHWIGGVVLILACSSAGAAEVRVRAHGLVAAPARLWVAPLANLGDVSQWRPLEGRAHQGARPMIPPPADEYTGDLPPGDYALAGYSKAGFVLPGTPDIPRPLRAARAQGEHFKVSPEGNTDLGELEVYADGSLGLMLREGPDNPAWKLASSDAQNDPVVAALRARVRTASVSET